jgi:hypothetical protein
MIKEITVQISPAARNTFDVSIRSKTDSDELPLKVEMIWALECAIKVLKTNAEVLPHQVKGD